MRAQLLLLCRCCFIAVNQAHPTGKNGVKQHEGEKGQQRVTAITDRRYVVAEVFRRNDEFFDSRLLLVLVLALRLILLLLLRSGGGGFLLLLLLGYFSAC